MRPAMLALALLLLFPAVASASAPGVHDKCRAMTGEINRYRSPDLYHKWLLCDIAQERAQRMARLGSAFHDLAYVVRRLQGWGGCWRNVGEAIAYSTRPSAQRFAYLWRASSSHWSMLSSSRYDRGGGTWVASADGRSYAVLLVMDEC